MKSSIFRVLMTLIGSPLLLLLGGCNDNEIVYPKGDPEIIKLYKTIEELIAEGLSLPSQEAEVQVRVQEDEKWTLEVQPGASLDETWMSATPTDGSRYTLISIRISTNPYDTPRSGILRFTIEGWQEAFDIDVTQQAAEPYVRFDTEKLVYGVGAGTQKLVLTTNVKAFDATLTDKLTQQQAEWLELDDQYEGANPEVGEGTVTYYIKADINKTGDVRHGSFNFTSTTSGTVFPLDIEQRETLATPVITLHNDEEFKLSWPTIVGADGYRLILRKGEAETAEQIDVIEIQQSPNQEMSYNLAAVKWIDTYGYVGKVFCQLEAYLDFKDGETEPLELFSNIVSDHNFFDAESGEGTESDPFIVTKPRHVSNIRNFLSGNFRQTADIDFAGYTFTPVSTSIETDASKNQYFRGEFTGTYDAGKGNIDDPQTGRTSEQYKILNLQIEQRTMRNVALFAEVGESGILRNICLENPSVVGDYYAAALVGSNKGLILSCHTAGNGLVESSLGKNDQLCYVAGLAGYSSGDIEYCSNTIKVNGVVGTAYMNGVGGIVALVQSVDTDPVVIRNCHNTGLIFGHHHTAGIAGRAERTVLGNGAVIIRECSNKGDITSQSANGQAAGILGYTFNADSEIERCFNNATLTAQGTAAGILGRVDGALAYTATITDCYNRGNCSTTGTNANGNCNSAGIFGGAYNATVAVPILLKNCYNTGTTSGPTHANGTRYFSGLFQFVATAQQQNTKVVFGDCFTPEGTATMQNQYVYISDEVPAGSRFAYKNVPAESLKQQATFTEPNANWDFDTVWEMGTEYPKLRSLSE